MRVSLRRFMGGAAVLVSACGGDGGAAILPPEVARVQVSLGTAGVLRGGTRQASATVKDASGTTLSGRAVSWSSSNDAVVTVSSAGVVMALDLGEATITATSEGKAGSAGLTVVPAGSPW